MNVLPVRGSSPWIAMRKRRPQPAIARSGQDADSALMIASTISFERWLVHSVTGRARIGPHDRALLGDHLQRPERAVVLWGSRRRSDRQSAIATAACMLACEELTKLVDCGSESDRSTSTSLPFLVTLARDADVGAAMAVIVEKRLAVEDAVLPGRDHGARLPLGASRIASIAASTTAAPNSANSRDSRRSPRCAAPIIAARSPRKSRGLRTLSASRSSRSSRSLPRLVELERRDAQALLPDLGGRGVVGAMRGAADVALVRAVDGPEQPLVAVEDRHEGGQIGQMVAAVIGIVEQEDVARLDVLEPLLDRVRRPGQRADMDRQDARPARSAGRRVSQIASEKSRLELRICE